MSTLKEQYDKISSEREKTTIQIDEMENSDVLKRYLDLCKLNKKLENQQKKIYQQMKFEEYLSCNHIWVVALKDYDSCEECSHIYHGCIKCGLDDKVLHLMDNGYSFCDLTLEQKTMYNFLENHLYLKGISINKSCDLNLAIAIYSKIKEAHPDIDDETARKYFEISLDNIRKIKVNDERKKSRAKRLSLNPDFNRWM